MRTAPDIDTAIEWAKAGQSSMAQCPAHDDGHASLSVGPGSEQPVLLKCHAGCETSDIIAAAGIDWDEVCEHRDDHRAEGNVWTPSGPASHVYPYLDEEGRELFQTLRIPLAGGGKTFSQRHASPSEKSGWAWNLTGVRRVPYRLPQIIRAVADGQTIVIVEGEKDADRAVADGYAATCCPMGAGKWQTTYGEFLKGAEVVIVADADDAGRAHALAVYDDLVDNHGCRVKIVQSSIAKDYTAHRQRGGTFDSLSVKKASYFTGSDMSGMGIQDFLTEDFPEGKVIIPGMLAEANVFVLVGPEGHGKALALDTPLPTPSGWTTMGEVSVGDELLDSHGDPCRVTFISGHQMPEVAYRVTFSDGSAIDACSDHQWVTLDASARERVAQQWRSAGTSDVEPTVRTTQQIKDTLRVRKSETANHAVMVAAQVDLPEADLPVPPYTFGVWLGDGNTTDGRLTISRRDGRIADGLTADGLEWHYTQSGDTESCRTVRVHGLRAALRESGALGSKHIPARYLRSSLKQRLDLLAGICDTDGYCDPRGMRTGRSGGSSMVEVVFTSEQLARDLTELVRTVGIIPRLYEGDATVDGRFISRKWRVCFQSPFNPFRYAGFKAERWQPIRTLRSQYRYITDVTEIEPVPMQCVQVDSPDSTYLCGEGLIPTHNTTLLRQIAVQCAAGIRPFTGGDMEPLRVLYLDAENPEHQQQIDWRRLAGLAARNTGSPVPNDNLWIMSEWRSEPDLTTIDGQHLLYEAIANYRPHLCLMGPVQNLVGRDVKDDEVVRKFKHAINTARSICGTAFGIEHHAPHRAPGDKERQMRPYGSSLFMKWPDFGYGLKPTEEEDVYDLYPFRRPRVRSRAWPERLRWGKPNTLEFPWEEAEPESATIFHPRFGG